MDDVGQLGESAGVDLAHGFAAGRGKIGILEPGLVTTAITLFDDVQAAIVPIAHVPGLESGHGVNAHIFTVVLDGHGGGQGTFQGTGRNKGNGHNVQGIRKQPRLQDPTFIEIGIRPTQNGIVDAMIGLGGAYENDSRHAVLLKIFLPIDSPGSTKKGRRILTPFSLISTREFISFIPQMTSGVRRMCSPRETTAGRPLTPWETASANHGLKDDFSILKNLEESWERAVRNPIFQ